MEWQQQQWRDHVPSASQALVPVGAATVAQDQTNSCPASFEFSREEDAAHAAAAAAAAEAAAAAAEEAAAAEAAEAEAAEAAVVGTGGISLSALALFPYNPATAVAAAEAAAAAGSNGREKGDSVAEELPVAAPAAGAQQRQQQRILLALPDDYTAASAVPLTCDHHHHHHNTRSPFSTSPVPGAAMPTTQPAAAAAAASRPIRSPGFAAAAPASAAFGTGAASVEEGSFGNSGGRSLFGEPQEQPLLSSTAAESALRNEYQVVLYKNRHIVLYNPQTYRAGARCLSAAEERAINEHRLAQCPLCGQAVDSHQFSFEARTYFQILQQLFRRLRRQQRRCAAPAAGGSAARFAPPSSFSSATEETAAALSQNGDGDSSPDPAARVAFPSRETARRAAAAGAPPPLPFSAAAAALPPVFPQQQQQASGGTAAAGVRAPAAAGIPPPPPLSAGRASRGGGAAAEFFTRATGNSQGGWGAAAAPDTTAAQQPRSPQETTPAGAGLAANDQPASRAILEHQQQGRQQQKSDCTSLQASAALLNEAFESENNSSSNAPKEVQRTEAPAASAASAGRAWQSKDNSRLLFSSAQSATAAAAAVGGGGGGNGPAHATAASGNAAADCIPSTRNIPVELLVTGYYRRFFVEREKLGSGSYGQVYLCTHILDELTLGEYAVKKLPVGDDKHWLQKMLQEVKIREKLHHPNIVDYKHSWLEMHRSNHMCPWVPWLFVLMEYCNGGSLEALIWDRGVDAPPSRYLTDDEIWLLLLDVLLGLQHLHQSAILYRDMKPSNVLLQHLQQRLTGQLQCRALLADFGTAELLGEQQRSREAGEEEREKAGKAGSAGGAEAADATAAGGSRHRGYTGTIEFTAPEVLQTDRYGLYGAECDTKSDMWSLGIILYAMCYARLPYLDKEPSACRRLILAHQSLQLPEHPPRHPTLKLLIQALTSKDPALRPSTDEVLEDPRVRDVMNDRPRLERAGEELALLLQQRRPSKTPRSMHQHNRHASAGTSPGRAARARRGDSNSRGRCIPRRSFVASLPPIHPSVVTDERENERGFPSAESAVALTARGPNFKAINLSLF